MFNFIFLCAKIWMSMGKTLSKIYSNFFLSSAQELLYLGLSVYWSVDWSVCPPQQLQNSTKPHKSFPVKEASEICRSFLDRVVIFYIYNLLILPQILSWIWIWWVSKQISVFELALIIQCKSKLNILWNTGLVALGPLTSACNTGIHQWCLDYWASQ